MALRLIARQRLYYVSQRRNDSRALGISSGLRARVYRRGRTSAFVQFDLGVADAAVALPPGGTRFNYLAIGGGGVMMQMTRRLQAIAAIEVIHISNAGLAGPDRNPDIEAIGPSSDCRSASESVYLNVPNRVSGFSRTASPFELVERLRPVVLQQLR